MQRGDLYELPAPRDSRGHEQKGSRPGVVLQADALLRLSTWIVAPTSTSARGASFRPEVVVNGRTTRVLTEQMAAIDPERLGPRIGSLSFDELRSVENAARVILGL